METEREIINIPQYSPFKILGVWAAAAVPMAILGWVVAPALAGRFGQAGFERIAVLAVGLIWQFVLVLILLQREAGRLDWRTFTSRLWLNGPRSPSRGERLNRLWWLLVPLILLTTVYELLVSGAIERMWVTVFPSLAEPAGFRLAAALATPEARSRLVGAWGVLAIFLVSALFNTFLGEELLFRGLLLPRMADACGRWDWVINGLLFGVYHLHQPWVMLSAAIQGMFLFALPSRRFRSAWFGVIAHSGESIYFSFLLLGLVLGKA